MIQNLYLKYRKAVAALLGPVVAAAGVAGINWIATGIFDTGELRIAAAGAVSGLVSLVTTALAKPNLPVAVGIGSDQLLEEATDPALGGAESAPPLDPERKP